MHLHDLQTADCFKGTQVSALKEKEGWNSPSDGHM